MPCSTVFVRGPEKDFERFLTDSTRARLLGRRLQGKTLGEGHPWNAKRRRPTAGFSGDLILLSVIDRRLALGPPAHRRDGRAQGVIHWLITRRLNDEDRNLAGARRRHAVLAGRGGADTR